jgi:hypothetical protein
MSDSTTAGGSPARGSGQEPTSDPTSTPGTVNSGGADSPGVFYIDWLREIVTALLAAAIVVIALWMLVDTYIGGSTVWRGDETATRALELAYNRQKDVLLLALSLLGTVTGYYLGRVPAELRAQQAQQTATTTQTRLSQSQDRLNQATNTSARAMQEREQAREEKEQLSQDVREKLTRIQPILLEKVPEEQATLGGGAPPEVSVSNDELRTMQREIDDLLRRVS